MFNKIIIFGLGLIGGSIAKSIKLNNICKEIQAFDTDKESLNLAIDNKIIHTIFDYKQKLHEDDLVIISGPLTSYNKIVRNLLPILHEKTTMIDVGSVKSFINVEVFSILGDFAKNFVPCHPIAGLEKSGLKSAKNDLFVNKKIIITKHKSLKQNSINNIEFFWKKIGGNVEFMSCEEHDKIFALTSHLPQLISYDLKKLNLNINYIDEIITKHLRLENSNIKIWQEIFILNKENIDNFLSKYRVNLILLKNYIINNEQFRLFLFLEKIAKKHSLKKVNYNKNNLILEKNVFCRILAITAYLEISDLKFYSKYKGSGFEDFTIIINYLNCFLKNKEEFNNFIDQNKEELIGFLNILIKK
jgi:prephenate dehydrogenase